ncbi:MAG: DUF401 family protein [Candidatus Zixiibacteriota bacterium]
MDALKLVAVLAAIVIALRKKVPVGITLFGAGVVTALLYGLNLLVLLNGYWELIKSERFISLTAIVVSITILGALLKELGYLTKLTAACRRLPGGGRTAATVLPTLVGLMPMPGGSLLSAPLVDNVLAEGKHSPEFKLITNYWFRHIAEFCWPIYPGLILTEALTGMPIYKVSLLQMPMTFVMASVGLIFITRKIELAGSDSVDTIKALGGIAGAIWPIALAIGLYAIFKLELAIAVVVALVLVSLLTRPETARLKAAFKEGISIKLVFLVFGILSFQTSLELTGAIKSIPTIASSLNLPAELVIFLVCFAAGMLTGMVAAYVGLGYTLLASYLYQPQIVPSHIFLAYISGFLGIILSPTHLCLILTNEYFGSDLLKVYRKFTVPVLIVFAIGLIIYISPWPEMF